MRKGIDEGVVIPTMNEPPSVRRVAITIRGIVQGVGFRPFVYNAATSHHLDGWVLNESDAVRMEVEGSADAVAGFLDFFREAHPRPARIDHFEVTDIAPLSPDSHNSPPSFLIRSSGSGATRRPTVPADMAICDDCLREIREPTERRYRYPFTNCTGCGPRWSIITSLPYDRSRTSMKQFVMCEACLREYEDTGDRRFHAQPIACPECGPSLQLLDASGHPIADGPAALAEAVEAIRVGQVVALKGLGGFQLVVDATDAEAVVRLRHRKRRPDKPFAVMLADLESVRSICFVSELELRELTSPEVADCVVASTRLRTGGRRNCQVGSSGQSLSWRDAPVHATASPSFAGGGEAHCLYQREPIGRTDGDAFG